MFDLDPDAWCDCGCDDGDDGYKSDFQVVSVGPDGARAASPVGLDSAIYESAAQAEDELACSFGLSLHASTEFVHRMWVTQSLKYVDSFISHLGGMTHVLMLHLRGQGSHSGFRLKDKHLTPAHIVQCLKGVGFRGTVVCVLNCFPDPDPDTHGDDPATAWASASAWSPDLPFKWVLISSTSPPGTAEAALHHGNKVTKMVAGLVRERVSYADLEAHMRRWWTPDDAGGEVSEPVPRVAMGGPYSGRFMQHVHS